MFNQYQNQQITNTSNEDAAAVSASPPKTNKQKLIEQQDQANRAGLGASSSSEDSDKNIEKQLKDMKNDVNMLF